MASTGPQHGAGSYLPPMASAGPQHGAGSYLLPMAPNPHSVQSSDVPPGSWQAPQARQHGSQQSVGPPGPQQGDGTPRRRHSHRRQRSRSRHEVSRHEVSRNDVPRSEGLPQKAIRIRHELGDEDFVTLVAESVANFSSDEFRKFWSMTPKHLRNISLEPPPGVTIEVDSLPVQDRPGMHVRLNELRRERVRPLACPNQQKFYDDDAWHIVPMSKNCYKHFWDVLRLIPLHTSDPARWGNVETHLKKCPEKPDKKFDVDKYVDRNARAPTSVEGNQGLGSTSQSPPKRSRLEQMAEGSPATMKNDSRRESPPDPDSREFENWITQKVEVDVANFKLEDFTIEASRKFSRKQAPEKALKSMPSMTLMRSVYKNVYAIYHRKLSTAISHLGERANGASRSLEALCKSLNIEWTKDDEFLPKILARLRATDMIEGPL
jgi:hypothetical protein